MPSPATYSFAWFVKEFSNPLILFGFAAQFVFFLRFAVQWYESERLGRSTIPLSFWYLSIAGGMMFLIYGVMRADVVIIFAQLLSTFIYVRNLTLIHRERAAARGFAAGDPK